MARTEINTNSPQYKAAEQHYREWRDMIEPHIVRFLRLTQEQQKSWVDKDPLMNRYITDCMTIAKRVRE